MTPATKSAPEPVPDGVCHHCFARAVARRRFSIDKRTVLLCEDRCAPSRERFVTAIATRRGEAVEVEQEEAPTVIEVSRGRARMPEPEPPAPAPEPSAVGQRDLFGGGA